MHALSSLTNYSYHADYLCSIPKAFQGDQAVNVARNVKDTAEVARGHGFESHINHTVTQRLFSSRFVTCDHTLPPCI